MKKEISSLLAFCLIGSFLSSCNSSSFMNENNMENSSEVVEESAKELYQIYRNNGGTLTYADWLASIKGEKGEKGDQGLPGKDGLDGKDGQDGAPGKDGQDGKDGASLLTGSEEPSVILGNDGDSYINISTWDFYVKENGQWVVKGNLSVSTPKEDEDNNSSSDIPGGDSSEDDSSSGIIPGEGEYKDPYGIIPDSVVNSQAEIDFLVYIEGQNGTIKDIGNYSTYYNENGEPYDPETGEIRRYGPQDLFIPEMARYFGAASAFKKVAPDVKINLIYCSISEYNDTIRAYKEQYSHFPHIMCGVDDVYEMIQNGISLDLSGYADSEYYNAYNEYFMTRFNFGGFQGGFPISVEPWGVFVNTQDLEEYNVINNLYDGEEHSNEYKEWVDNFTWETFVDAVKMTSNETHAGLSQVVEYLASYSLDSINAQYIAEGTVDFTSSKVLPKLTQLLQYENELASGGYTVYLYDESSTGHQPNYEKFPNAARWAGTRNFCEDQYCTFYAEAPWALTTISQYINKWNLNDSISVDLLPYPMVDENSNQYIGSAVEGLTIGNQKPSGLHSGYSSALEAKHYEDVAAYFAMFMGADPRAIEANSEVKYIFDGTEYTGSVGLPVVKKGFKYEWQDNDSLLLTSPTSAYNDNWQYIISKWFEVYDIYVTNNEPADVCYFLNISYGLRKCLDYIYGDEVTVLNFWNEPVNVYEDGEVIDIFNNWQTRFTHFQNPETLTGTLGNADYVDSVLAGLADMENYINTNAEKVWMDLQDSIDMYYGSGKYNVLDREYRNNYEGSIIE